MSVLSDLIDGLISENSNSHCDLSYGPAFADQIEKVETELRVSFPPSFRAYLEEFAGGILFGYEIAGIPTEKAKITIDSAESFIADIVLINQEYNDVYPKGYVYFATDEGDNLFFIDTRTRLDTGENPILMYGPGKEGTRIANDFNHFVTLIGNPNRGRFPAV